MDSFFKENESIVNNMNINTNIFSSSNSSPNNKTDNDNNTMNEDLEDDEFDRIVSEAQRYTYLFYLTNKLNNFYKRCYFRLTQGTRAKPSRKTKSKGNHLKNLQNRIEIKNEYEQTQSINSDLTRKFDKSSV